MQRAFAALFVVLFVSAVGGVAPMVEARTNLNGPYAFTTARSCTTTDDGHFGTDGSGARTVITDGVFRQISNDEGTTTYNSDGTGISTGRSVTMNISATAIGVSIVSISEFSVAFTYTIQNDNQLVTSFGEGTFTTILGAGTGNTGTFSARTAHQQIGNGGNTIVTGPAVDIQEETLVFNSPAFTQHRLCTRSGTSVRM